MRRLDLTSGRVDVVPVPCGSRWEDRCRPCADKNRRLRMVQCREGWHLDHEPMPTPAEPTERQKAADGRPRRPAHRLPGGPRPTATRTSATQIREIVAELDQELRGLGVRGRLAPLDPDPPRQQRSTRRRQDAPNLPRRPVERAPSGRSTRGQVPALDVPHAHLRHLRAGRRRRRRARPGLLRLPPRGAGRDPLPEGGGPVLAEHCAAAWAGRCSTSAPSNRSAAAPRTSTPPSAAPSPAPSCGRSPPPPTTRCGGRPTTRSSYTGIGVPRWDDDAHGFVDPDTGDDAAHLRRRRRRADRAGARRHARAAGAREGHPRRHRGSRPPRRLPHQVPDQVRVARPPGSSTGPDRAAARAPPPAASPSWNAPRARRSCPIWLLYGIQPRKVRHTAGARGVQGQGAPARAPRHRRPPRPRLAEVVEQDPRTTTTPSGPRSFGNC